MTPKPLCDIELEMHLLGCLLRGPQQIDAVRSVIATEDLTDRSLRQLYAFIVTLWDAGSRSRMFRF